MPNDASGGRGALAGARPRWGRAALVTLALGLMHAVLTASAFEPVNLWWLAPATVTPLAVAGVLAGRRAGGAWLHGMVAAMAVLPLWLVEMSWVRHVSAAGYVPVAVYLSLYAGACVWVTVRLTRRWGAGVGIALGLVGWVALEVVRARVAFGGFSWFLTGHPLIEAGPLLTWPARLGGEMLVSMLAGACGWLVAALLIGVARVRAAGVLAALVAGWVGGGWIADKGGGPAARRLDVAVVQTNVPQSVRGGWDPAGRVDALNTVIDLTYAAADTKPGLIVWPETMFPGIALEPDAVAALRDVGIYWRVNDQAVPLTAFAEVVLALQQDAGVPLLVGASGYRGFTAATAADGTASWDYEARFNSAYIVDGGLVTARYDKVRLTPFGEVMPYVSAVPALERALLAVGAAGMAFDLTAGRSVAPLPGPTVDGEITWLAAPICFEATDAGATRRLVGASGPVPADLMVNITNDGWFGAWRSGRLHHFLAVRWRCVELDRAMVRAANTGVSAFVDRWGRVVASGVDGAAGADQQAGVLTGTIELGGEVTPYAGWGWVMPWVMLAMGTVPIGMAVWPRRGAGDGERKVVGAATPAT